MLLTQVKNPQEMVSDIPSSSSPEYNDQKTKVLDLLKTEGLHDEMSVMKNETKEFFSQDTSIQIFLDIINKAEENSSILEGTALTLISLVRNDENIHKKIIAHDGIRNLIDALNHPNCPIRAYLASLLGHLGVNSDTKKIVNELHGIEALITILKNSESLDNELECTIVALYILADKNQDRAIALGGVKALIAIVGNAGRSEKTRSNALITLSDIFIAKISNIPLIDSEDAKVLIATVEDLYAEKSIVPTLEVLKSLGLLVEKNRGNRSFIESQGGIEKCIRILLELLSPFDGASSKKYISAILALTRFASSPRDYSLIVEKNGIEILTVILKNSNANAKLYAALALSQLIDNHWSRIIEIPGCAEALIQARNLELDSEHHDINAHFTAVKKLNNLSPIAANLIKINEYITSLKNKNIPLKNKSEIVARLSLLVKNDE